MNKLLLLFVILFFSHNSFAQKSIKKIYFVHQATKIPIQDVSVIGKNNSYTAISNEQGFIELPNYLDAENSFIVSMIGFEKQTIDLNSLNAENNISIIYLQPKISTLDDVVLKSSANKGIFKTISDLDIHIRPIVNSQEILRIVPGLFIGQHAGGGKAEQIFIRGFDIDHGTDIAITVDGMPVNMVSHAHGQGYADLHFLIPELIEKVNFNKGPYFSEIGNLGTAGYVSFKTKNYLENNFIKTEGGQFNTLRTIAGINLLKPQNNIRNKSLYIAGEYSFTKGYFESPQNFNRINTLLKYHNEINSSTSITVSLSAFTSKWNASGQIPDRAVEDGTIGFFGAIDNDEGGKTSRYNANFEITKRINNGATIRNQFFYSRYAFELYSNFTFFKEDPINGDQIRQKEARNILGYNSSYTKEHIIGKTKTLFTAGAQIRYDDINNIELSRTKNRTIVTNPISLGDVNELNAGIFVSEKIKAANNLDVTIGVRGDYFTNQYKNKIASTKSNSNSFIASPKLNFNYRVNDKVQLYWYNGQGFHSNDTRVSVVTNGKEVVTPAWGSDIGTVVKLGKNTIIQSALWYLWLKQEFVYVGDEGVVEPGGQTRRLGFDLSIRHELLKHFYVDADITVANPKAIGAPKGEDYLPLAPRFTSTGGVSYRKATGFNGSLRYRYMDNRPANEDYSVTAKGYFITDAAINYTQKKWELGVAIQNLFNTKWKETQFDTESRLQNETEAVSEIHFTPGSPFFARLNFTLFF